MENNTIWIKEAAHNWEQGLPVSSGNTGAVLFGEYRNRQVLICHKKHWLPLMEHKLKGAAPRDMTPYREKMLELCNAGKFAEADAYWYECREQVGLDGFVWYDPIHPAAKLVVRDDTGVAFETRHIIDAPQNEARIVWESSEHDGNGLSTNSMALNPVSDPELIVFDWHSSGGEGARGIISLEALPIGKLRLMGGEPVSDYIRVEESCDGTDLVVTGTYATGEQYEARARVYIDGEVADHADGEVFVRGAKRVRVLMAVTDPECGSPTEHNLGQVITDAFATLDEKVESDRAAFADVFNRVTIDLNGDSEERELPTDALLEQTNRDREALTPALCEKIFQAGRYLIWSASQPGAFPSNLQGAWNGLYDAPWMGGYTQDENVQLHYWQLFQGNMFEATQPYFDYMERQIPHWRENAEKIHGLPGVLATINASRTGFQLHAGPGWPWDWFTGAAGWLAQYYWDHYLFTGDRKFLEEKTVPLLKEIVAFYEAYSSRDENGQWACIPSISPENTPVGASVKLCGTTTMDVAIAKEVYSNLIHACGILGLEDAGLETWKSTLESLPDYKVNEDGAVKEWMDDAVRDNYMHRHQSHIYPVFPGTEVNPDSHPELMEAFGVATRKRLQVGIKDQVGWSLSHMAGIFARLGDAENAYECIKELANGFLERNLFSYCMPGHIVMNLDGILGCSAAMQEMLLQSYPHNDLFVVKLLPALPKAWPDGSFSGMCVRGGAEVSAGWKGGKVESLTVTNNACPATFAFDVNGERAVVTLDANETWTLS